MTKSIVDIALYQVFQLWTLIFIQLWSDTLWALYMSALPVSSTWDSRPGSCVFQPQFPHRCDMICRSSPVTILVLGEKSEFSPFSMRFGVNKTIVALSRHIWNWSSCWPSSVRLSIFNKQRRKCARQVAIRKRPLLTMGPGLPAWLFQGWKGSEKCCCCACWALGSVLVLLRCWMCVGCDPGVPGWGVGPGTMTSFMEKLDSAHTGLKARSLSSW